MVSYKDMGYKLVFVSLDGSDQQGVVLERAITVAVNNGARLVVGHVVDTSALEAAGEPLDGYVEKRTAAFKESVTPVLEEAQAHGGLEEYEVVVELGRVRETLKDKMLDAVHPDIVVCGARGLSNIKYALLGSISTFLVRESDCDVLVVK